MTNIIPFDYQGQAVRFNTAGWINATEAARHFGKRPNEWLRLPETQEYMEAVARHLNAGGSRNLIRTARGRLGGTWLHPKLAVSFARWLSADFAVWCDMQIDALIRQGMAAQGHEHLIGLLLRPEASEWERRFPPSYYQALAKVSNTRYLGHAGGTPSLFGRITRKWIYQIIMPREVLAEMDARRTDSDKLHQWLTDGGAKMLERQIALVTMIANTSADLSDFEGRCMQAFAAPGQLQFVYPVAA